MKTATIRRQSIGLRIQSLALIGAVLISPCLAPEVAQAESEAPTAPTPQLQLHGTLASINIGPSKLDAGPAQAGATVPTPALKIVILEGEDVSNNIKERTAREPIVQVEDENHKPVAGAAVFFSIDSGGGHAGASFLNGAKTFSGQTDANGRVVARGFHPNAHTGQFHVNVTANKGPLSTRTQITQTNVAAATSAATSATVAGFVTTHVALVSVVAAAAVAGVVSGVVVATNGSSSTSITTGTGTVGAPQISHGAALGARR